MVTDGSYGSQVCHRWVTDGPHKSVGGVTDDSHESKVGLQMSHMSHGLDYGCVIEGSKIDHREVLDGS